MSYEQIFLQWKKNFPILIASTYSMQHFQDLKLDNVLS